MCAKKFKLRADEIRQLAPGHGACMATDEITVEGLEVAFMYRESPADPRDSGWRFFAGTESQEYLDDPENSSLYDVNTIANYDPTIMPYLDAAVGSAFARKTPRGPFSLTDFPAAE
jgi:hypothetical protein